MVSVGAIVGTVIAVLFILLILGMIVSRALWFSAPLFGYGYERPYRPRYGIYYSQYY